MPHPDARISATTKVQIQSHPRERWTVSCCALNKRDGRSLTILEGSSQGQKRSTTQILTLSDPKIRGQEPKTLSKRAHNPLWIGVREAGPPIREPLMDWSPRSRTSNPGSRSPAEISQGLEYG